MIEQERPAGALPQPEVVGVSDTRTLAKLKAAHADLAILTPQVAAAAKQRREAALKLIESGHSAAWIAEQLGVTRQAVHAFLKSRSQ